MAESQIEKTVCNKAEAAGYFVRKVQWLGRRGAPDRLFIRDGVHVWIEFKDGAKPPSDLQLRNRRHMREAGAEVHVVGTVKHGLEVLGIE